MMPSNFNLLANTIEEQFRKEGWVYVDTSGKTYIRVPEPHSAIYVKSFGIVWKFLIDKMLGSPEDVDMSIHISLQLPSELDEWVMYDIELRDSYMAQQFLDFLRIPELNKDFEETMSYISERMDIEELKKG